MCNKDAKTLQSVACVAHVSVNKNHSVFLYLWKPMKYAIALLWITLLSHSVFAIKIKQATVVASGETDTVRVASLDMHPPRGAEVLKTGMIVISANGYTFKQGSEMGCEWLTFLLNDIKDPDLSELKLEVEDPETGEIRTVVVERYPAPLYK